MVRPLGKIVWSIERYKCHFGRAQLNLSWTSSISLLHGYCFSSCIVMKKLYSSLAWLSYKLRYSNLFSFVQELFACYSFQLASFQNVYVKLHVNLLFKLSWCYFILLKRPYLFHHGFCADIFTLFVSLLWNLISNFLLQFY